MAFVGKYQRTSVEKYDEFLTALGVSFLLRKAATASTPVMEVTEDNGKWCIKTSTLMKSMTLEFELDKEFEETTADGRDVKAIVTKDDNKLISVQTAKKADQKSTKVTREFLGDKVIQTMEVVDTDVVCKQVFERMA